jgi:hypothetical protein
VASPIWNGFVRVSKTVNSLPTIRTWPVCALRHRGSSKERYRSIRSAL